MTSYQDSKALVQAYYQALAGATEETVADVETQSRHLLDFLDLPFEQ